MPYFSTLFFGRLRRVNKSPYFVQLTPDQVCHIAKLARINLTDVEVEKFTKQLDAVMGYIEKLNQLDTEGVTETNQITGLTSILREDEVKPFGKEGALIAQSQNPITGNQIKVRKSI